ncbi:MULTISPECIES: ribbon-helix-helix protein, CopG family [Streptomyces]|uniref:Ribbon-helix-helix protein CopG domain-containing protein n=1 Tax=Streptomyces sp. CMC78 TaxID=3231512 RepID=A0AB33KIU2_9ACTN
MNKPVTARGFALDDELWERLRVVAQTEDRSMSSVVRQAIRRYLADLDRVGADE